MNISYFRVADLIFKVSLPQGKNSEKLLPAFSPFVCNFQAEDELLFHFSAGDVSIPSADSPVLEESVNDLGYVRLQKAGEGYRIELRSRIDSAVHLMYSDTAFTRVEAEICWEDPYVSHVLTSLLRIVCSQAVLNHGGIALHAAAVIYQKQAYLFMGCSGTGKSTHARLWQKAFEGCELLNDDNPIVRIKGDQVWAYGTPWSGKTPCYRNLSYPVGGIARLNQSAENKFFPQQDVGAFTTLLPGCSVIRQDNGLYDELCDTLVALTKLVPTGRLSCRIDEDAAWVCLHGFKKITKQ